MAGDEKGNIRELLCTHTVCTPSFFPLSLLLRYFGSVPCLSDALLLLMLPLGWARHVVIPFTGNKGSVPAQGNQLK